MSAKTSTARRWYVAYTQPRQEDVAVVNLRRQGFASFVPRRRTTERQRGQFATKLAPVFPRYVFVGFDVERQRWRSINGTRGVVHLLCVSEHPVPLREGIAEGLMAVMDDAGVVTQPQPLAPGDEVRVIDGPLTGLIGRLERLDDGGRVNLLLSCLGAPVRARLPRTSIAPVTAQAAQGLALVR